jgi:hypothetical protein
VIEYDDVTGALVGITHDGKTHPCTGDGGTIELLCKMRDTLIVLRAQYKRIAEEAERGRYTDAYRHQLVMKQSADLLKRYELAKGAV